MRSYSVAVASLAIDAPQKWTDNLLSHHDLPDVVSEKRGVARRIPHRSLIRLALIRELQDDVGLSAREAVALSGRLLQTSTAPVPAGPHVAVFVDLPSLERTVAERLRVALESAPAPRRGRARVRATPPGDA